MAEPNDRGTPKRRGLAAFLPMGRRNAHAHGWDIGVLPRRLGKKTPIRNDRAHMAHGRFDPTDSAPRSTRRAV